MKLVLLIISIILFIVTAILFIALPVTFKHLFELLALGFLSLGIFAASFLPVPGP
jgi:hypothetical protein